MCNNECLEVDSGAYQLIMRLDSKTESKVGALGTFQFAPGIYVYSGRASARLRARIRRHLRTDKTFRWHVDYLLQWARVELIHVYPNRAFDECLINRETARSCDAVFPVRGFGASGCSCPAHLPWLGEEARAEDFSGIAGVRVLQPFDLLAKG